MRATVTLHNSADTHSVEQNYGDDPLAERDSDLYRAEAEFVSGFVDRWDQLIDWDARARSEGHFFADVLRAHHRHSVADVATGTGFHSVRLSVAGFDATSIDGSATMLEKARENGRRRGVVLNTVQADWRELNSAIHHKYYYYCGDRVTVAPEHIDDGLARFKYSFPDGRHYTLNVFPLRKAYVRGLMCDAGFVTVRTYGDFEECYQQSTSDFFIHVAAKTVHRKPFHVAGSGHPGSDRTE